MFYIADSMSCQRSLIPYSTSHSAGAGRVWGSDEVNIEGWKALKRLPGHESGMCCIVPLLDRLV